MRKAYLKNKFDGLEATRNPDTIAYVYAPGTKLDEPVVQTTDNSTYLDKTFDRKAFHIWELSAGYRYNKKDFGLIVWPGSSVMLEEMELLIVVCSTILTTIVISRSLINTNMLLLRRLQRKYYYEALAM